MTNLGLEKERRSFSATPKFTEKERRSFSNLD